MSAVIDLARARILRNLTDWTYKHFWTHEQHPYALLRRRLRELAAPGMTILDAGCGHTAPNLQELRNSGAKLIGVDLVRLEPQDGMELIESDLGAIPLPDGSVGLICSRSVMEHVVNPDFIYAESARLLKAGGRWIFLTANRWDYVSLISRMTPNRFHAAIVRRMEGREEFDVFPTAYKTNDRRQIAHYAEAHGFRIERFERHGQYPAMFYEVGPLFLLATFYEKMIMKLRLLAWARGWLYVELVKR
jgi:SAM-dependent methyltransferase